MASILVRTGGPASGRRPDTGHTSRAWAVVPPQFRAFAVQHLVGLIAIVAVLLRVPALVAAPGADEAGFLMVGHQWSGAGSSLYANYWVDRPPVLITIFRIAAELGGMVPLRLIGCLATVLLVTGVASVARRIGGRRAAGWAALAAAGWCVSGLTGSAEVNGELLAAPFVVWGIDAALASLTGAGRRNGLPRSSVWRATAAGGLAVLAVLVKQNFADVGVFALTFLGLATVRGELTRCDAVRFVGGFTAGATAMLAAVCGWTVLHGTSLVGVYDAMYPFRLHAAHIMAGSSSTARSGRFDQLLLEWVLSGFAVVTIMIVWRLVSRRARSTPMCALVALLMFDMASALIGGNYWSHYLMQLVVPAATLVGVLVAGHQPGARTLVVVVALVGAMSGVVAQAGYASSSAQRLGRAIGASARPGDTIVTVYGHSDVDETSGLSSPYRYLWSLPLKTLDPHLHALDHVLAGPDAPTWFVTYAHVTSWGVGSTATAALLTEEYHPVAVVEGHTIYLHDEISRPTPSLTGLTQHIAERRSR